MVGAIYFFNPIPFEFIYSLGLRTLGNLQISNM